MITLLYLGLLHLYVQLVLTYFADVSKYITNTLSPEQMTHALAVVRQRELKII